jgi:pimeloyl-ACP methyl ester carboxylesterase
MVEINGVDLHYLDWGGEGELLLFVPGLGGTAYIWNGIAPHFNDRYRVVALTPREHGVSEKPGPPYTIEAFAAELEAAISHFSTGPAIVVGHSFAGVTMTELVRRAPSKVAGMAFIDALYDFSANRETPPSLPGFTPPSVFPSHAAAVQWYLDTSPTLIPELLEPYVRSQLKEDGDGQFTWQLSPSAQGALVQQTMALPPSDFEGISVPVVTLRVQQTAVLEAGLAARGFPPDTVAVGRRFAEEWDDVWKTSAEAQLLGTVSGAKAVVLDSVSHLVPIERPDLVIQVLDDFLAATRAEGS